MSAGLLEIQFKDHNRVFRVELIRSSFLVGAHFYDDAISNEIPVSFVATANNQQSFGALSSLNDTELLEKCVHEFKSREHLQAVFEASTGRISVGRHLKL